MVTTTTTGPRIAARARHLTPAEWQERALQLAWNEHTIGTVRYQATDGTGNHIYTAFSRSQPLLEHIILINLEHQHVTCDCIAADWGSPCAHAGAAIYAMRQMVSGTLERNLDGQRQYEWWAYALDPQSLDAS